MLLCLYSGIIKAITQSSCFLLKLKASNLHTYNKIKYSSSLAEFPLPSLSLSLFLRCCIWGRIFMPNFLLNCEAPQKVLCFFLMTWRFSFSFKAYQGYSASNWKNSSRFKRKECITWLKKINFTKRSARK